MKIIIDTDKFHKKIDRYKKRVAKALEGAEDGDCRFILNSFLFYGWKKPEGEWHPPVHDK